MKYIFLLLLLPSTSLFGQITPERMNKLKLSTIRVSIDSMNSSGTGFFINDQGQIVTCWHVIQPALIRNQQSGIINIRKIFVQIENGQKIEVIVPSELIQYGYVDAVSNDYCVLIPKQPIPYKFSYLKIGDFNNIKEGEEVYTCGYPLGMYQPFVSKGMISTKFIDSATSLISNNIVTKVKRDAALLDLTLNKGNSGGAILKFGKTTEEDEVIGIADFIINPFGKAAEEISYNASNSNIDIIGGKFSMAESITLVSMAVANASNGMSGCLSINLFTKGIQAINKQTQPNLIKK